MKSSSGVHCYWVEDHDCILKDGIILRNWLYLFLLTQFLLIPTPLLGRGILRTSVYTLRVTNYYSNGENLMVTFHISKLHQPNVNYLLL